MQYEALNKVFYKNNENYEKIYLARFNSECTIRYNFSISKQQAFVNINLGILNLITHILQMDKQLHIASNSVPPIALLQFTKKCIIDEIQLTNEIEGVQSTRKEIRELIDDVKGHKERKRLYGLVQKYLMLSQREHIQLKTPLDIRKLYDEFILEEIKSDNAQNIPDGDIFRKDSVEVVSPSQKVIHKGLYPEAKIIAAMTEALDILHDKQCNHFVNMAIFHYMFGYIHPFYDGNGRMARFISSYLLTQELEPIVGFGLSYTIKNNIKKYYDMFKDTNDHKNKGDLTPFVIGFLEFVVEAVENLWLTIKEKAEQFKFYVDRIPNIVSDRTLASIIHILVQNSLFDDEGISIEGISRISGLSPSTIRNWIKKMPPDIVTIRTSGKMNLYSANLDAIAQK